MVDGLVEMLDDRELIEDDLAVGVLQMRTRRLDVRLPHVHRDGLDAVPLCGRQRGPEAIQTLLLPVLGQIEHPALFQIRHHRQVPVPLRNGFFIDTQVRHHVAGPATQSPSDGPLLDSPRRIPSEAHQPGGPGDRALSEQVDGQPFEPGGELTAGLCPGHGDLLDPMGRTGHSRHVGRNPGRQLAGIQMPPSSAFPIVARDCLLTLRTRMRPQSSLYGDGDAVSRPVPR